MDYASFFPTDYENSRLRFVNAATQAGAATERHAVPVADADGKAVNDLSIDVATIGQGSDLLIVSSGLHGVEGFFGAAVQLALLAQYRQSQVPYRLMLIHAMNPWGYRHLRRVDEGNIDLNRNFPNALYTGAPAGYHRLNGLLNPAGVSRNADFFTVKALANIARFGMPALKEAVASGQYEYPRGLFFGGNQISHTAQVLQAILHNAVTTAERIFHVDIHTGLGKYGQCKLLVPGSDEGSIARWCQESFPHHRFEAHAPGGGTAYPVNGMLGDWLLTTVNDRPYHFIGAEVGTYSPLRVLGALRRENACHFYGQNNATEFARSKQLLLEHFCPANMTWRRQSVRQVIDIVQQVSRSAAG